MTKKIVILGGGFGGIRVALDLEKISKKLNAEIILINKNNYQDFYIDLYEIASAFLPEGKNKQQIRLTFRNLKRTAAPIIKEIFKNKNVKVFISEVKGFSIKEKIVYLSLGQRIKFDYLVLALGSQTNYFNIPNLESHSLGLKSVDEAINIRNVIDELFYRKNKDDLIKIVIGGGGFSGCELAGELVGYLNKLSKFHNHSKDKISLSIVEACDELLKGASAWARKKAKERLEKLGVNLFLNSKIINVFDSQIILEDGRKIAYDLLIWTAGIKANEIILKNEEINKSKNNCAIVNEFLQVEPHKNVFAVGDNAYCFDEKKQCVAPATAYIAINQAKIAARNIENLILSKPLVAYKIQEPKFLIPLGEKYALADLGLIKFKGIWAWFLKRIIVLKYYLSIFPIFKALKIWFRGLNIYIKND